MISEKEKIKLIELILRDIRLNWTEPKARVMKAKELCLEIGGEHFPGAHRDTFHH